MEAAVASFILKSRSLSALLVPVSKWYMGAVTHRQYGLKYDDILMEENPEMQEALRRLPSQLAYERHFRHKYAFQLSVTKAILPKEQQTPEDQDVPYLQDAWNEVLLEKAERDAFDHPKPKGLFA
eukprot:Unigene5284_Nuclearia_a/m.16229 Unigene5284_Nuclearia_a/g.16229  ORF Unigene5284_Nuclearia_a/g.16229 Unigene5284_Nuclearia_a/m.16229 type:complete len:125 (+) Unigene5284_Nuclearia_a:48-422(+)